MIGMSAIEIDLFEIMLAAFETLSEIWIDVDKNVSNSNDKTITLKQQCWDKENLCLQQHHISGQCTHHLNVLHCSFSHHQSAITNVYIWPPTWLRYTEDQDLFNSGGAAAID